MPKNETDPSGDAMRLRLPSSEGRLGAEIAGRIPSLAEPGAAGGGHHRLWPGRRRLSRRYRVAARRIGVYGAVRLVNGFGAALMQRTIARHRVVSARMHF